MPPTSISIVPQQVVTEELLERIPISKEVPKSSSKND
jgi:hypothetical protein